MFDITRANVSPPFASRFKQSVLIEESFTLSLLLSRPPAAASERRGFRFFRDFAPGKVVAFLLFASLACAMGRGARASTFQINVAATNLTANTNYGLSFELQNMLTDNSLQASISNFSLLGGTLIGSGGSSVGSNPAAGNLNSTLSLATFDGIDFFETSDYIQSFSSATSSALMTFTLNLSSSAPQTDRLAPDFFRFSFLDSTSTPVGTTAPMDSISFVYAAFDTTSPSARTFRTSNPSGPQVAAQIQPNAAPEPGTLALVLPSGAATLLHYRRKRISARS